MKKKTVYIIDNVLLFEQLENIRITRHSNNGDSYLLLSLSLTRYNCKGINACTSIPSHFDKKHP